jgi:Rod binding domain-containing protein
MSRVDGPVQREAMAAYLAAGKAAPGSREARGRAAADGFESTFIQNMLESVFSGLGEEGPLGSGSAGGGAWRGFYAEELSKSMARGGGFGIAPQVYREMFRAQEISRPPARPRTEGVTLAPVLAPT